MQSWSFAGTHFKSQGAEAAGAQAFETVNAGGAVDVFKGLTTGGATPFAGLAMDTLFFVKLQTEEADPIEQTIESPQRAQDTAEKPADQNGPDDDDHQPGDLVPKIKTNILPQRRFNEQER